MRRNAATAARQSVATAYEECARRVGGAGAQGPAEIELLAASLKLPVQDAANIIESCGPIWSDAYRAAENEAAVQFIEVNAHALKAVKLQYLGALEAMRTDDEFVEYLTQHLVEGTPHEDMDGAE